MDVELQSLVDGKTNIIVAKTQEKNNSTLKEIDGGSVSQAQRYYSRPQYT